MKDQTELEALQAKYDALSTEYHLIRKCFCGRAYPMSRMSPILAR